MSQNDEKSGMNHSGSGDNVNTGGGAFIKGGVTNSGGVNVFGGKVERIDYRDQRQMADAIAQATTKDDFLNALRQFKAEIEAARQTGLPEDTADDALVEVNAAEQEAQKETPKPERITKRLEQAKATLGIVTTAAGAVAAVAKLEPLIEGFIHAATRIF